jgi:hypothetical protein
MSAPGSATEDAREFAVFDTKLASECDKEFAVEANCDCLLFGVSITLLFVLLGGLASVFSRRSMPPTAY